MSLMVAVLQDAFLLTSALGLTLGRKCESANKVLLIVHTSFSVILTWIMLRMIFKALASRGFHEKIGRTECLWSPFAALDYAVGSCGRVVLRMQR